MAVIEYTAADRAPLISGHVVGGSYFLVVKLIAYEESIDQPKTKHIALNGNVETVLKRATRMYSAVISWPDSFNGIVEEFLFSVAGGELFTFDAYGTFTSPDNPVDVVSVSDSAMLMPIQRSATPTRRVSLMMRPVLNRL